VINVISDRTGLTLVARYFSSATNVLPSSKFSKIHKVLKGFSIPSALFPAGTTRVAVISAKNHKRQRRKRQTKKVANAKGLNRITNLA